MVMAMKRGALWGVIAVVVVIIVIIAALSVVFLTPSHKGKVSIYVKDAQGVWSHVNVTFSEVQIHAANASGTSGWLNLTLKESKLDLASLVNVSALLAQGSFAEGKYTQIRIVVLNVTGIMTDGTRVNFTVPSGELKTTHPFNITAGSTEKLTLEIDLDRSIVHADGKWIFTPVLGAVQEG